MLGHAKCQEEQVSWYSYCTLPARSWFCYSKECYWEVICIVPGIQIFYTVMKQVVVCHNYVHVWVPSEDERSWHQAYFCKYCIAPFVKYCRKVVESVMLPQESALPDNDRRIFSVLCRISQLLNRGAKCLEHHIVFHLYPMPFCPITPRGNALGLNNHL